MKDKFILQSSGIGDVIIFISYINRFFSNSKNKTYIDFDKKNIQYWRDDVDQYYPYLVRFGNFLLPNDNIVIQEGISGELIDTGGIFNYYSSHFSNFEMIDTYHKLNIPKDSNKIVLHTKVRNLHRGVYNSFKKKFYDILNNSDKEFIILGEREVEYGKEYTIHGDQVIYSIYDDVMNNLDKNKIMDLSMPKYGISSPNFEVLMNDIDIMSKHKNICLGSGGVLVLCSFACSSYDLLGCISRNHALPVFLNSPSLKESTNFIEDLPNFIK